MKRRRRRSGRVLGLSLRALVDSSPACVAYKRHMERLEDEISKAFGIPKAYVTVKDTKIKRIRWRIKWILA